MTDTLELPEETPEPYVNEDCPEWCDKEHDAPPSGYADIESCNAVWACPTTSVRYVYDDGDWTADRWAWPEYVHGEWYVCPQDHGYYQCDHCGTWDDVSYNEMSDYYECGNCWTEEQYDDYDGEYGSEADAVKYAVCTHCRCSLTNQELWFDIVTEDTYCLTHKTKTSKGLVAA